MFFFVLFVKKWPDTHPVSNRLLCVIFCNTLSALAAVEAAEAAPVATAPQQQHLFTSAEHLFSRGGEQGSDRGYSKWALLSRLVCAVSASNERKNTIIISNVQRLLNFRPARNCEHIRNVSVNYLGHRDSCLEPYASDERATAAGCPRLRGVSAANFRLDLAGIGRETVAGDGVVVLRVGDAWLVGAGKRAPHGFRCPCLVSPHGSLDRLKSLYIISSTLDSKRQTTQILGTR